MTNKGILKDIKVIKKDGKETIFDIRKIERSIIHANMDVSPECQMTEGRIHLIAQEALDLCIERGGRAASKDIRDVVENSLITLGSAELAKKYIRYGAAKMRY